MLACKVKFVDGQIMMMIQNLSISLTQPVFIISVEILHSAQRKTILLLVRRGKICLKQESLKAQMSI